VKQNIFSILFFVLFCFSQAVPGLCQSELQSDSLSQNSTSLRPIDLIPDQPFWNTASPDLFTFWLDSGLYGYYGPQPQIMLDHIPVNINFLGWQNLNMLPVHLSDMSEMKSASGWQLYQNSISAAGTVDFISREPESGLSMDGSIYWGNESGDPGPWIYDSTRVTPNVDRWGPDVTGTLSYKQEKWYAKSVFSLRNHQQTDPKSHRRLHRTMRSLGTTRFNTIQTSSKSGLIETGFSSDVLNLKVRGIQAEDENYLFLQPFGREVPAQSSYGQLAAVAKYSPDSWSFNLNYIWEDRQLKRRNSEHDYIFNWDEQRTAYLGSIGNSGKRFDAKAGFKWEQRNIDAPGLTGTSASIGTFFVKGGIEPAPGFKFSSEAGFDFSDDATANNFRAGIEMQPIDLLEIELTGSYQEVLPIKQESIAHWVAEGYTFFDELGINYNPELDVTTNRLAVLQLRNIITPTSSFEINFLARFIHHYELNVPWQEVSYSPQFDSAPGFFEVAGESGSRLQLHGSLAHTPVEWLTHIVGFDFNRTIDGPGRYRAYFLNIPKEKATYHVNISPVQNLAFSIKGRYQSSTRWREFDALDGQSYEDIDNQFPVFTGVFRSTVPSHFNVDVGARKWFWDRKLNLQFTIQNLFNDEVYLHPMGADRSLLFNIKAEARF